MRTLHAPPPAGNRKSQEAHELNGHHQDFVPEHDAPIWAEVLNRNLADIRERQEFIIAELSNIRAWLKRNDKLAANVSTAEATASNPQQETIMKYQGKDVTARPAKQGDKGFDAAKGEQLVITLPDGTQKTVAKADVTDE